VLSVSEVQQLLDALALIERTLVLLDVGTGLRMSELFGLKWKDVDFDANEISVVRSIVMQETGPCKTESSQKPVPLDPYLAEALQAWRQQAKYSGPEDWVFASPSVNGQRPYWGQQIMRKVIRPIAIRVGITKGIGWHTFRHYAESRTMPSGFLPPWRRFRKISLDAILLCGTIRHSPVRFTGS
jgi:integrase